jgi:protein subunit release factor B
MTEDKFQKEQTEAVDSVEKALAEIENVRAYVLKPKELVAVKIAQYALRYVSDEFDGPRNRKKLKKAIDRL